jgi:hypothetical protein
MTKQLAGSQSWLVGSARTPGMSTHGTMLPSRPTTHTSSPGKDDHEYELLGAGNRNWLRMLLERARVERPGEQPEE